MDQLGYDLLTLCRRNHDGGKTTQYQRSRSLRAMSVELKQLGYRNLRASRLKPKHVQSLVNHWKAQKLSSGAIKNRVSHIRWWAEKVGKPSVVPRDNASLGIDQRIRITNTDKSVTLDQRLNSIKDPKIRMSLELQKAFGLRREESIKFQPKYADRGHKIVLKPSWTKGGHAREIPVRNEAQRQVLDRAHEMAGSGSLIPDDKNYGQHLKVYEWQTSQAGFSRLHGLRHAYAQERYQELTGRPAPAAGGPSAQALSPDQKRADHAARLTISRELGHGREQVTVVYLGR